MSLRILFLMPNIHQGGAQRTCIDVANQLSTHHNCVVTIYAAFESSFYIDLISSNVNLIHSQIAEPKSNLKKHLKFGSDVAVKLNPENFDVIVCGWEYAAELALYQYYLRRILFTKNKPRLYTIIQVSLVGIRKELNFYQKIFFDMQTMLRLLFFKRIIVVCSALKREPMLRFHPNTQVIHSCVDVEKILLKSKEAIDPALSPICEKPYIINVGRINKQKNQLMLVQAFSKIHSQVDYNLIIIGAKYDIELTTEIENFIETEKLGDRIYLVNQVSNPFPLIKNAIANVLVSYYEGFPVSILESFVLKVLVVSSKFNGFDDFLNSYNSLLFDLKDFEKLKNYLLNLNNTIEETQKMTFVAQKLTSQLTPENVAKNYLEFFNK